MITLRPATINDLDSVKYWDSKQHVIDCDPNDEWNWEIELKHNPRCRTISKAYRVVMCLQACAKVIPLLNHKMYG